MIKCSICGNEIRYISSARLGNNGIIAVDPPEEELISESGRLLRGFRRHECPEQVRMCTREPMNNQDCHAYNGGECMNGIICAPAPEKMEGKENV